MYISGNLVQFVKVPTRLNPDAILDPIITTMTRFYCDPVTKPPLSNDQDKTGKPSDHLVVLMLPKYTMLDCPPRKYRIVKFRALPPSGIQAMGRWVQTQNWSEIFDCDNVNEKAQVLQDLLSEKLETYFPLKTLKICEDDQPWVTNELKILDRSRKREFFKKGKSDKWKSLNAKFQISKT